MTHEIELINDGDGVAVIGDSTAVEQFLASQGLPSKELDLKRISSTLNTAAGVAQAGAGISAESGRWVKLTKESAAAFDKTRKMTGSRTGVSRAILTEDNGKIKGILEIVNGPGQALANPAMLAGAAGVMAQMAMQQTMDEITDYLAVIDAKVDDVLRAQKDAVIADMIGVDFVLDEAMTIRDSVGRVSEITWSKVQSTSLTIGRTQAYALKQLSGIAEKLESQDKVNDLADVSKQAERTVQEWLAVLAHCFRLQDGIALLELDRVLDASPGELDDHREGLQLARQRRLDQLATGTASLLQRMDAAAGMADAKLLLNPMAAPRVLSARNKVHNDVISFQQLLGIDGDQADLEGRRWRDAALEARDKVVASGSEGLGSAVQAGSNTLESARLATGKAAEGLSKRLLRKRTDDEAVEDETASSEDTAAESPRSLNSRASKFLPRRSHKNGPEGE
ncbi:hypothetical protein [Dietzia maris]|uniref:hypothetical protein n=1 Tax=Dietzia maris TaxID=37915 RepID=UPI00223A8E06|nr:hypothetical protein [Dietzia maris]MCT1434688.1 hypothetical protein [Dietzia maris]MCT1521845.1 hypothetical protein [Dietzia maris]